MTKAVILAGGYGTRIAEETSIKPKPMVEIGNMPIIWHIMKTYSHFGINEFIICCGYKGYYIKEYFANYFLHKSDIKIDIKKNEIEFFNKKAEDWKISLIDTGDDTNTGGRLLAVKDFLYKEEFFCFTYGDGVGNINIKNSILHHISHKKIATLTGAYPPGRFGAVKTMDSIVESFDEKPKGDGAMVNAGFFILSPEVFKYIEDSKSSWEKDCLPKIVEDKQLTLFEHHDFWQPMDTLRDKNYLENLWNEGNPPWRVW